jgi:tetratricopeptide (TPR) repeat protein
MLSKQIAERSERKLEEKKFLDRYAENDENSLNTECSICYEMITKNPVQLKCEHSFCLKCIDQYVGASSDPNTVICPLCRSNEGQSIVQSLYRNAVRFKAKAEEFGEGDRLRLHYCALAKNELAKLLEGDGFGINCNNTFVLQCQAEVTFLEGNFETCVHQMEIVLEQYEKNSVIKSQNEIGWFEALLVLSKCHRKLNNFGEALRFCRKGVVEEKDPKCMRNFFHEITVCYYETGEYEAAISIGEGMIEMNRHYEGAYTHVALSHNALGNLDACIDVFRRAVLYETPWDAENVAALREQLLYYEDKKRASICGDGE